MILNTIYLYLKDQEFEDELLSEFDYRTRKMRNFLQRHILQDKVRTENIVESAFTVHQGLQGKRM